MYHNQIIEVLGSVFGAVKLLLLLLYIEASLTSFTSRAVSQVPESTGQQMPTVHTSLLT